MPAVEAELRDIEDEARRQGVELDVEHASGGIRIRSIRRRRGRPGAGARVIETLIAVAEEHGIALGVSIVADHDALVAYYETLGFEIVRHQGERIDMATSR